MLKQLFIVAASLALAACATVAPRQLVQDEVVASCKNKITSTPLLPLMSTPKRIDNYCQCAGGRLMAGLSNGEVAELAYKGKDVLADPKWQGRLLNSGVACLKNLVQ